MIDKDYFLKLRKEIEKKDKLREEVIVTSRPITKNAKLAIYALHRNSMKEASDLIAKSKKDILELKKIDAEASNSGSYSAAAQEYAEAATYMYYLKEKRLAKNDEIGVDIEDYLSGLSDLTGELGRRVIFSVVDEKYGEVLEIKDFVSGIYEEFLKFDFRNGELRKKNDSIKWNLKKIEEVCYDLKIRGKI
ncbi:MAG: hypothetical protein ABIJ34_01085 [archaeon]